MVLFYALYQIKILHDNNDNFFTLAAKPCPGRTITEHANSLFPFCKHFLSENFFRRTTTLFPGCELVSA
jgi:hypothetical protein